MSATTTTTRPPARRRTPIDGLAYPRSLLKLVDLVGEVIHATVPSTSRPDVLHRLTIPRDPHEPIRCGPTCPQDGKPHWHVISAEDLRDSLNNTIAMQTYMSDETLRGLVEWLHPDQCDGIVVGAYLAARYRLALRQRAEVAA